MFFGCKRVWKGWKKSYAKNESLTTLERYTKNIPRYFFSQDMGGIHMGHLLGLRFLDGSWSHSVKRKRKTLFLSELIFSSSSFQTNILTQFSLLSLIYIWSYWCNKKWRLNLSKHEENVQKCLTTLSWHKFFLVFDCCQNAKIECHFHVNVVSKNNFLEK